MVDATAVIKDWNSGIPRVRLSAKMRWSGLLQNTARTGLFMQAVDSAGHVVTMDDMRGRPLTDHSPSGPGGLESLDVSVVLQVPSPQLKLLAGMFLNRATVWVMLAQPTFGWSKSGRTFRSLVASQTGITGVQVLGTAHGRDKLFHSRE